MEVGSSRVGVEMQQRRPTGRVANNESGFLGRFPQCRCPWSLARVNVTAGLQPASEALVPVQNRSSPTGHDGRSGDVDRVIIPTERIGKPVQLGEEPGPRGNLALCHRVEGGHRFSQLSRNVVGSLATISVHGRHHARYRSVCANSMGEDCLVRWTTLTIVGAALIAALVTACSAGTPWAVPPAGLVGAASAPAGSGGCYAFLVSAVRQHVVVRRRPPACAGLPQAQVNQDVARAIRTVVGAEPKAIGRRLAVANSRYLANLVRPVRPPPPVSVAAAAQTSSGDLALRFSALAAWLAAALAGAYLLAGWLTRGQRRRLFRYRGVLGVVPLCHAGLAIAGLLIWIAFTATALRALAWADVGLTWVIAGLGMATLLGGPSEQADVPSASTASGEQGETSTASFPGRAPVLVIALHGALATLTILLVLLAAVGVG